MPKLRRLPVQGTAAANSPNSSRPPAETLRPDDLVTSRVVMQNRTTRLRANVMNIDLRQTRTLVISCQDQPARRQNVQAQLAQVGMRCDFVEGVRCQPGIIGCAISHLKALTQYGDQCPFLLLEDDCAIAPSFRHEWNVPPGADLAYLGISIWGVFPEVHRYAIPMGAVATRHDDTWLQLHNMVSAHAVLYLKSSIVSAAKTAIIQGLVDNVPFDINLALLQKRFLALTPNEPCFFQDARFRGAEQATKQRLIPVSSPADVQVTRIGQSLNVSRPMPASQPQ